MNDEDAKELWRSFGESNRHRFWSQIDSMIREVAPQAPRFIQEVYDGFGALDLPMTARDNNEYVFAEMGARVIVGKIKDIDRLAHAHPSIAEKLYVEAGKLSTWQLPVTKEEYFVTQQSLTAMDLRLKAICQDV